jgi:hypothetical protein
MSDSAFPSTAHWPEYTSHKIVRAAPIVDIKRGEGGRSKIFIYVQPTPDAVIEVFETTVPAMKDKAAIGGYGVVYEDGFHSISPKEAFENGYTLRKKKPLDPADEPGAVPLTWPKYRCNDDGHVVYAACIVNAWTHYQNAAAAPSKVVITVQPRGADSVELISLSNPDLWENAVTGAYAVCDEAGKKEIVPGDLFVFNFTGIPT